MKNGFILFLTLFVLISCKEQEPFKRNFDFNQNWYFTFSDSTISTLNASQNSVWELVNFPHTWHQPQVSSELAQKVAYYKKHFNLNLSYNQKAYLWFNGVSDDSEYWINGHKLDNRQSRDSSFYYDISNYITSDGSVNEVMFKLVPSFKDTAHYGMCKNVCLVKLNKLHIPIEGTHLNRVESAHSQASYQLSINLYNAYSNHQTVDVVTEVIDANEKPILELKNPGYILKPGKTILKQVLTFNSSSSPHEKKSDTYLALTKIYSNKKLVDVYQTELKLK